METHDEPGMDPTFTPISDDLGEGATDPTRDYVLEIAIAHDALELHRVFFDVPRGNVRRLLLGEVRRLIDDEAMWLARERLSGHIVGVCTIDVPRSPTGEVEGPAELGGPVVLPGHRRRGLGTALASMAIAHHFWDEDPAPLLAHVEVDERMPRTIMGTLGFGRAGSIHVPCNAPGLPFGPEEGLEAEAFVLEDEGRASAFWRVATYLDRGSISGADGRPSPIYLEAHPEMTPFVLRSTAASILLGDGNDEVNAA